MPDKMAIQPIENIAELNDLHEEGLRHIGRATNAHDSMLTHLFCRLCGTLRDYLERDAALSKVEKLAQIQVRSHL